MKAKPHSAKPHSAKPGPEKLNPAPPLVNGLPGRSIALAAGWISVAAGLTALAGMGLDVALLRSFLPGASSVKAATIIGALAGGLAIVLAAEARRGEAGEAAPPAERGAAEAKPGPWTRRDWRGAAILFLGLGAAAMGFLAFLKAVFPLDPGLDRLLYGWFPGRALDPALRDLMSPLESASYAIVGIGCIFLRRARGPVSAIAGIFAFEAAYLSFAGHVYGVRQYGALGSWAEMSFPATLSLMSLGVGLLAASSDRRPALDMVGEGSGARLLRKTILLVFAIPLAIGFFVVHSVRTGAFDLRFGGAVTSLLTGIALSATLFVVAKSLARGDEEIADRTARLETEIEERKQVESELRKVTRAVEQSPVAVIITDNRGSIEYANAKFCEMTGYPREEVLGRNPRILNSGLQPRVVYEELWRSILGGEEWHGVFMNRRKNGGLYWAQASISPIRSLDGKVGHFIGMTEDITALKAAQDTIDAERKLLRTLVDAVPESIIIKDLTGTILVANRGAARFFGVSSPRDLVGRSGDEYLSPWLLPEAADDDRRILATGEQVLRERQGEGADGERIWYSLTKLPVVDEWGKPYAIVALSRDISLAKTVEESLERARAAAELARAEAESMNAAKTEFLANMSHEIRTPMNAIIGMTQIMRTTSLSSRQEDILSRISSSADLLLEVINDILDISKIESGKLQLEARIFSLSDTLAKVEMVLAPKVAEKGLDFSTRVEPDLPDILVGDSIRLRQILLNLAGNAVKFTQAGSVRIEALVEQCFGDSLLLRFKVRDTGIGIAPELRDRLFQPFSQADSSMTRRYGGTGLGLAIAKSLVQAMGGEIGVESEEGKGSVFTFTARLALPAGGLDQPRGDLPGADTLGPVESIEAGRFSPIAEGGADLLPDPSHLAGLRILLVEDNRLNVLVAREMLEAAGAKVTVALDGEKAIGIAETGTFDVVLMDVQMPGISGYDAAKLIHALSNREFLPIVAVTANAMAQDREKARAAGMCGYLPKPFRYADLLRAVSGCVHDPACGSRFLAVSHNASTQGRYAETDPSFASMEGIDLREGLDRAMGDPALFVRMLRLFRRDLEEAAPRLEDREAGSDLLALGKIAHSIKGGAGNAGAKILSKEAAALEAACRAKDARMAEEGVARLGREIGRVLASTALLATEEGGGPEGASDAKSPVGSEVPLPLLDELRIIALGLERGSVESIDRLLELLPRLGEILCAGRGPADFAKVSANLAELRADAESFDLDKATRVLRDILAAAGRRGED